MAWKLAAGTGFCEVGGELVFLDLARDKYMALRGEDRSAFDRLRCGEPNDSDAMTRLIGTGFLARTTGPTPIEATRVELPELDLTSRQEPRFSPVMGISAAWALRWARRAMRPERIAATIERLRIRKSRIGVPGADDAVAAVAASYAASRWINPMPQRCLVDALALDRILLSRGLAATMVFGVRLQPFAAHCWLQSPGLVLTGTAAEARGFTPILGVG
jgi:hypothetical protein